MLHVGVGLKMDVRPMSLSRCLLEGIDTSSPSAQGKGCVVGVCALP